MISSQFNRPLRPPAVPAIRPPTFIGCRTFRRCQQLNCRFALAIALRLCQRTWATTFIAAFVRRPPSMQPSACASGCLTGLPTIQPPTFIEGPILRRCQRPTANSQSNANASALRRVTLRLSPRHDLPVVPAISVSGLRRRFPSSGCPSGQFPACAGFPGSSVHSPIWASDSRRNPHPSNPPSVHTWLSPPIAPSGWPAILFRLAPEFTIL